MRKPKRLKVPSDFPAHLFRPVQPLKWDKLGNLKNRHEVIAECEKREQLLSEHFNIPLGAEFYDQLCQAILMVLLIPDRQRAGRRPRGEAGRKERERLLQQVETMMLDHQINSDLAACEKLRGKSTGEFSGKNTNTLRKLLRVARSERAKAIQQLAEYLKTPSGAEQSQLLPALKPPVSRRKR